MPTDPMETLILAADVGGTNLSLAIMAQAGGRIRMVRRASFLTFGEPSLLAPVQRFLADGPERPVSFCVSGAGPLRGRTIPLTNAPWDIDAGPLEQALGIPVRLINDFTAVGYGVLLLDPADRAQLLALQAKRGIFRYLSRKKQDELADTYIQMIGIKTSGPEQPCGKLSGGNQQKVILARWLATDPQFLILDEPTRGIDVGAKAEIMDLVVQLCQKGLAILFIASELEEVVRCCTRVAVLRDRVKITELEGAAIDENAILHAIAGVQE